MINEKVFVDKERTDAYFITYCSEDIPDLSAKRRKGILVLPGGGYNFTSEREAEVVAKQYFAAGFNAFVLYYSCAEKVTDKKTGLPKPLLEASMTMNIIRQNADKYNTDAENIAVIGFSAGGHLAASLGTLWYKDFIYEATGIPYGSNKPSGMILCYPVIFSDEKCAHVGSFKSLLSGSKNIEADMELYSIEKQVTEKTVPAFLWHTAEDTCAPVRNSLLMAEALSENKIPFELHIYPKGNHGLSTASFEVCGNVDATCEHISEWVPSSIKWLNYLYKCILK